MDRISLTGTKFKVQSRARTLQLQLARSTPVKKEGPQEPSTSQLQAPLSTLAYNDISLDPFHSTPTTTSTVTTSLPYSVPIQVSIPDYSYYPQEVTLAQTDLLNAVPPIGFCCKCHKLYTRCTCFLAKPFEQINLLPNTEEEGGAEPLHVCQQVYLGEPIPREGDSKGTISVHVSGTKARAIETYIESGKIYCKVINFGTSRTPRKRKQ